MYIPFRIPESLSRDELIRWLNEEFNRLEKHLSMPDHSSLWFDNLSPMTLGRVAAGAPAMASFRGLQALRFVANDAVYVYFHINHDIAPGSKIYPHIHWASDTTTVGNVTWNIEYTFAAGHSQETFPVTSNFNVQQSTSGTAYMHYIAEASDAQAFEAPEVDSVIIMKITLAAKAAPLGAGDGIFGLFADLHYQRSEIGTPYKAPGFYDEVL